MPSVNGCPIAMLPQAATPSPPGDAQFCEEEQRGDIEDQRVQ
jgi:hypothetical protein